MPCSSGRAWEWAGGSREPSPPAPLPASGRGVKSSPILRRGSPSASLRAGKVAAHPQTARRIQGHAVLPGTALHIWKAVTDPQTAPCIWKSHRASADGAAHPETCPASRDGALHLEKAPQIRRRRSPSADGPRIWKVAVVGATARRRPGICGDVWRSRPVGRRRKRGSVTGTLPRGQGGMDATWIRRAGQKRAWCARGSPGSLGGFGRGTVASRTPRASPNGGRSAP